VPSPQPQIQEIAELKNRLLAIVELVSYWQDRFDGDPDNQPLADLLGEFDRFARNYFVYFCTQGQPKTNLPHELNSALDSLHEEWVVISRACEQREIAKFEQHLKDADKRVEDYYARFQGYKANALPVTYFEKLDTITRYIFTRHPLISIPLQLFNDNTQWQGLAHELGHYIYWNSAEISQYRKVQSQLRNAVLQAVHVSTAHYDNFEKQTQVMNVWSNWLEETVADVCGVLLAGPMYVVSGQRRVEESAVTAAELAYDDGGHPAPYLRPLIALEALTWVAEQPDASTVKTELEQMIASLRERWANYRRRGRGQSHETSDLKMWEIENELGIVVQTILGNDQGEEESGTWITADSQPDDLGHLIDCKPWLDDWQRVKREVQEALDPKSTSVDDLVSEPSPEFDELIEYLETEHGADKVRGALLSLELKQERFWRCYFRRVRWVGGYRGSYSRCY
jgi:hypothetical protein